MTALSDLSALCKAGLFIEVNAHRNDYESVAQALKAWDALGFSDDIPADIRAEMIARDSVVHIKAYTTTPIGYYSFFHFDVDQAITQAVADIKAGE